MTASLAGTGVEIGSVPAGRYRIEPEHSTVEFRTRHILGLASVRGRFTLDSGQITVADPVGASSVTAVIAAASFSTGNPTRDTNIRSARYLDAEGHPEIVFAGERFHRVDGSWMLDGTLTVRGTTGPIRLTVGCFAAGHGELRATANASIDRFEFGITAQRGMTGRRLRMTVDVLATPASG